MLYRRRRRGWNPVVQEVIQSADQLPPPLRPPRSARPRPAARRTMSPSALTVHHYAGHHCAQRGACGHRDCRRPVRAERSATGPGPPLACCAATPVATGPNHKGRRPTPRADPVGVLVARRSSWTCTPAADELSDQAKRIGAGNGALRQGIRLPQQVLFYPNAFSLSTVLVVTPVLVLGRGRADRAPRGRAAGRTPSRTRRKGRRPEHGWSTRALVRGP